MVHKTPPYARCALLVLLAAAATVSLAEVPEPHDPVATGELPQYIFFNKSPTALGPLAWRQGRPESFTSAACQEIVDTLGARGNPRLRVGVHFVFSLLEDRPETLAASLRNLLVAAREADLPVLVTLDGQNWWESRSDLWNWWDPDLPGYDPRNRQNVEWTDWGPEHAVKICWRNWGKQIRVRPAPNIAAPKFLAEHWPRYDALIPILLSWYHELPDDKKYLFGGIKVGWEASINVNAYYYADGNRLQEQAPTSAAHDPHHHDPSLGWTFGAVPLGYAAVQTSGLKHSGTLTREDLEQVTYAYLRQCSQEVQRRGVPAHLIFTHQGGTYAPWEQHWSFKPAMNEFSIPGWSFYSHDPPDCGSLRDDLRAARRHQWAASEWWRAGETQAHWRQHFERTLGFERCRLITVYNWENFRTVPEAIAAVRDLMAGNSSRVSSDERKAPQPPPTVRP